MGWEEPVTISTTSVSCSPIEVAVSISTLGNDNSYTVEAEGDTGPISLLGIGKTVFPSQIKNIFFIWVIVTVDS